LDSRIIGIIVSFWISIGGKLRPAKLPIVPGRATDVPPRRSKNWQGSCNVLKLEKEAAMSDTTVTKVDSRHSPVGALGQKYLASGVHVAMRLWEEGPAKGEKPESRREYETVGYVIAGRAELRLEGQMVILGEGDSWVVPKGASHTYRILEPFRAVETTSPPAHAHGRDEPSR
jgi:mannose-6-phosphate isomerase-like protein (cupin superfamily)